MLSRREFAAPIQLEISNEGDAFAEHVEVSVSASAGYSFIPIDIVRSYLEIGCAPPDPLSTVGRLPHIPNFFEQQRLHQKDPFRFYLRDAPSQDRLISDISHECERFRHGSRAVLFAFQATEATDRRAGCKRVAPHSTHHAPAVRCYRRATGTTALVIANRRGPVHTLPRPCESQCDPLRARR